MAEADAWAEKAGIHQLFQALAFQLLKDRPDDILSYLAGLLSAMTEEKNHHQGFGFETLIETAVAKGNGKGASPPHQAINSHKEPGSDDEGLASRKGSKEQQDAEEQAKIDAVRNRPRRPSVNAGSVSKEERESYVKPVHAKPEEAKQEITNVIRTNDKMQVLFGALSDKGVADVVNAFYEMVFHQGESVINQGEEGNRFYLVDDGTFDILVARKSEDGSMGQPVKVKTAGSGTAFGELALMYNAPRAATVTCVSQVAKVWALDRRDFQILIMDQQEEKHKMYEGWLQGVPLLQTLNHYELSQVSELMEAELFEDGDEVMRQGDEGDKFYILEEGEARAYIAGESGEVEVKVYNEPGDYFGEIALLTNAPRRTTIRATKDSQMHSISKGDFDAIMGPVRDKLARDIGKYPQYAEFLNMQNSLMPQ